jgi:hypothetical protein
LSIGCGDDFDPYHAVPCQLGNRTKGLDVAKTKKGFDDLGRLIGATPPAELDTLTADELKRLNVLVESALEQHQAAMIEAEENVVNLAPRLMRGAVRKLLGANR